MGAIQSKAKEMTALTKPPPIIGKEKLSSMEWKKHLKPEEFHVIRNKGTEKAFSGEYNKFMPKSGYFVCKACHNPLYSANAKFQSGCGWPAFDKCFINGVTMQRDFTNRMEILCQNCQGHLGHVFTGERLTQSNERHCVNSISVKFVKDQIPEGLEEKKLT